ncbi:MAG TPA: SulP family inorganic anion transporter [Candidatus Eisenbacteria bacterium]|nr:SulP family inorganic anion transporter [Candidatus Eisenbacteria bacterium]
MPLKPKLLTTLKGYTREAFLSDLVAGVIVGVVALPLAIAFGIASGVSPEKGVITAIVGGFLISALGGSRVQIGGPTGAFIVIVYGVVQKFGTEGLLVATFLAGAMLIGFGLARLGSVIKFVPRPVIVGFTSGIAVIILSSQVKDFLGLDVGAVPADFVGKWALYFGHLDSVNPWSAAIAAGTVLVVAFWGRLTHRVPGSLVAIVAAAALVRYFGLPADTIGTRFGDLPHTLPAPSLPPIRLADLPKLLEPAFTIALLGGIESLLSAVVADGMTGGRHRSNMELIAQGTANIASSLFGGIPATGAIARTATNVKNGGRTPVAGLVHALTLMAIIFFFGAWARLIPLACLAGILAVVSYHMSEWRSFAGLLRGPRSDVAVLLVTFLLTVFCDLTLAIEVGMVLSAFLFMHSMTQASGIRLFKPDDAAGDEEPLPQKWPSGVEVYHIDGPFFFGVAHEFEETMRLIEKKPHARILDLSEVPFIDATGLHALREFNRKSRKNGVRLVLSGLEGQPLAALKESGLYDELGPQNVADSLPTAVRKAQSAHA